MGMIKSVFGSISRLLAKKAEVPHQAPTQELSFPFNSLVVFSPQGAVHRVHTDIESIPNDEAEDAYQYDEMLELPENSGHFYVVLLTAREFRDFERMKWQSCYGHLRRSMRYQRFLNKARAKLRARTQTYVDSYLAEQSRG